MKKYKILFVAPANATFCQKDRQILEKHYEVRTINYSWNDKRSVMALLPKVILGAFWCDLTFSWFGSFHAFLAVLFSRIFRKKAIVIAGGYDVVKMPEINYGFLNSKLWKYFALFAFRFCDKILAVSQYSKKEAVENLKLNPDKIEVIYHGFDANSFYPEGEKKNIVLTIGGINSTTFTRKGLKTFIEVSRIVPEVKFVIVGKPDEKFMNKLNLGIDRQTEFTGFVPQDELLRHLQRAKIYAQVSYHEGFGCALAEAMLCGCIPVVTSRAALPEVVGDCGFCVPYGDAGKTAQAIRNAIKDKGDRGKRARERIKKAFPTEERERRLLKALEGLTK